MQMHVLIDIVNVYFFITFHTASTSKTERMSISIKIANECKRPAAATCQIH